jgi:hypothetical protein
MYDWLVQAKLSKRARTLELDFNFPDLQISKSEPLWPFCKKKKEEKIRATCTVHPAQPPRLSVQLTGSATMAESLRLGTRLAAGVLRTMLSATANCNFFFVL